MPQRHRHGYAADLHRGLPTDRKKPAQEFPTATKTAGTHRIPAHIHRIRAGGRLEGLYDTGSSRTPSPFASRTRAIR
jgi:hypothetical protein